MRRSVETEPPGQTWRVPEYPFPIEWSAGVMEEIREAAMEALFSLPHGGVEIGGVLLGTRSGGRVRILAARPLECEHALGPRFTLSGKDHARLAAMLQDGLDDGCRDLRAQGWEPVGWYHSHTRSEILLSAQDVEIHNRYFPDCGHVALVVRPHPMQPMRAGFFFREADGSIHADSSYKEFLLQPAGKAPSPASLAPETGPSLKESAPPERGPVAAPPPKRARWWFWWPVILLGMAAGLLVFKNDRTRVFAADQSPPVSLTAYDRNGQLQIGWDWAAEPILSAEEGTLEIADGATRTVVVLQKQRLHGGTVGYTRIGAHVNVRLALRQPGGRVCEEFTSFIGQAIEPESDASTAKLRRELQDQAGRTRELERTVAGLRWLIQRGQESRRQDSPH